MLYRFRRLRDYCRRFFCCHSRKHCSCVFFCLAMHKFGVSVTFASSLSLCLSLSLSLLRCSVFISQQKIITNFFTLCFRFRSTFIPNLTVYALFFVGFVFFFPSYLFYYMCCVYLQSTSVLLLIITMLFRCVQLQFNMFSIFIYPLVTNNNNKKKKHIHILCESLWRNLDFRRR